MKTFILNSVLLLVCSVTAIAGNWTNYPAVTVPNPTDTFLLGNTTNNEQLSAQSLLNWTKTNALAGATNSLWITNPIVSGTTWTNETGLAGLLTVNYTLMDSSVSGEPSLNITNLDSGEWFVATNSVVATSISSGRLAISVYPAERVIVTNMSSGSADSVVDGSFFRP